MAPAVSEDVLVDALVDYVEGDLYPTSEEVASAKLPDTALPALLDGLQKGQETVKAELRELSRGAAGDLDGWISQAKQLQHDIEESKATANTILQEGEKSQALREEEHDASSKVDLLRKELNFNETLIGALEQIQIATGLLDKAKEAEAENELVAAVKELGNAQKVTGQLGSLQNSRFGGLLSRRAAQMKDGLSSKVSKSWSLLVRPVPEEKKLVIRSQTETDGMEISLTDTVAAMQELGTLESHVSRFYRDLDSLIISPRFAAAADGAATELVVGPNDIATSGRIEGYSIDRLTKDVQSVVSFLQGRLPEAASKLLVGKLLPNLLVQVVNEQLDPSVPVAVNELVAYGPSMEQVQELANFIEEIGIEIPSEGNLVQWIEKLPQNWLSRQREAALNALRIACYDAVNVIKTAERVETQMISSDDVMVAGEQQDSEWSEDWNVDEHKDGPQEVVESSEEAEDGEEAEGWGWGDDAPEDAAKKVDLDPDNASEKANDEDEDAEGWGWGDDDANPTSSEPTKSTIVKDNTPQNPTPKPAKRVNGSSARSKPVTQREITLRETFQISAIPDTLLELINSVLADASEISQPSFPIAEIRAAVAALSPIPTLLLALYRATARSFYSHSPVADMLIYNDSTELVTRLDRLLKELPPDHPLARRLPRAIESETKSLQSFSRLAYGREMDSQRTILSDLLSSTSGFESCTNPVNAREYQSAISDVVSRLREIDALWKGVLCESARRQSIGALLSHVIRKAVEDILELASEDAGISEPESKQLKAYLDNIAQLADLFTTISPDGEERSMVHVYTPSWLRFMYLGEILEASLADIKFLWTEGELGLEYESDEVVELIQALFAESEHRRGAIREIRKSARMSGEFVR